MQKEGAQAADGACSQTCTACACSERHPQGQARHVGSGSVQSHVAASRYTAQPAALLPPPPVAAPGSRGRGRRRGRPRGQRPPAQRRARGEGSRGEVRTGHTPPSVHSSGGVPSKVASSVLNRELDAAAAWPIPLLKSAQSADPQPTHQLGRHRRQEAALIVRRILQAWHWAREWEGGARLSGSVSIRSLGGSQTPSQPAGWQSEPPGQRSHLQLTWQPHKTASLPPCRSSSSSLSATSSSQ